MRRALVLYAYSYIICTRSSDRALGAAGAGRSGGRVPPRARALQAAPAGAGAAAKVTVGTCVEAGGLLAAAAAVAPLRDPQRG